MARVQLGELAFNSERFIRILYAACTMDGKRRSRTENRLAGYESVLRQNTNGWVVEQKEKKKKIASQRRGKGFCTGDVFFVRLTSWKCRGHVNPRLLDVRSRSPRGERKSALREKCPRKKRGIARAINFNWEQHVDVLHKPLGKSQFFSLFLLFLLPTFVFLFLFLVRKRPPYTSPATYPRFW